ncbi:membrane protein [Marivirga lumbricoides]|uniref:Membrane protein n=2 Tax=Marivirga lumbricoides TaxID=1046115 RepID=A0ABQ1MT72_9BACT|nr:membrane protein [Marivirga lumbricoides]
METNIQKREIMRRILLTLSVLLITIKIQAQQLPASYNYLFDPFSINPAYAGFAVDPVFNFMAKGNLNNVEGAPMSMAFSAHGQALHPNVAFGANAYSDRIGVSNTNGIYGSYSYKLISKNRNAYTSWGYHPHVLSFGIRAGAAFYNERLSSLNIDNDPNFEKNVNFVSPSFGVGVYYSKDRFFAGLSVPEVLTGWERKNLNKDMHLLMNAGYEIFTGHFTKVQVNSLIKYVQGAPVQLDGHLMLEFKEKLMIGAGYRSVSRMNFMIGFPFLNGFKLAYVYEMMLGKHAKNLSFNNHEINIRYRWNRR